MGASLTGLVALGLMGIAWAGAPARAAVAQASCLWVRLWGDTGWKPVPPGRIALTDYGFRDWGPELVSYSLDTKSFRRPVAAGDVTPPILAWKQAGAEWVGGARFFTDRKVKSCEIRAAEDGPATVAYEARYRFEPKGEYVWHVRVSTGVPVAIVTEEYDFGEITEGHDFLLLGLGENWQPQEIGVLTGEGVTTTSRLEPIGPYLERKSKEQVGPVKNVGAYPPPAPFMPGRGLSALEKIVPGGPWGLKSGMELRGAGSSISVCPYHTGSWRRTNSLIAWHDPARGVQLALPISVRLSHWYLDLTDDRSPFSSHEHDPDETALLFRCGYNHSHWDMDDLNVILVARGAPLSPGTGYQYYYGPANQNDAIYPGPATEARRTHRGEAASQEGKKPRMGKHGIHRFSQIHTDKKKEAIRGETQEASGRGIAPSLSSPH